MRVVQVTAAVMVAAVLVAAASAQDQATTPKLSWKDRAKLDYQKRYEKYILHKKEADEENIIVGDGGSESNAIPLGTRINLSSNAGTYNPAGTVSGTFSINVGGGASASGSTTAVNKSPVALLGKVVQGIVRPITSILPAPLGPKGSNPGLVGGLVSGIFEELDGGLRAIYPVSAQPVDFLLGSLIYSLTSDGVFPWFPTLQNGSGSNSNNNNNNNKRIRLPARRQFETGLDRLAAVNWHDRRNWKTRVRVDGQSDAPCSTLWCGAGNVARSEDDVGVFQSTDRCCRQHDNCPDSIAAGASKHGLRNTGTFTRSHCDCDEQFYKCLRADRKSIVSVKVGTTYFNLLRPRCFRAVNPCAGPGSSPSARTSNCTATFRWFNNRIF
ncbi:uncharacterized protein LOC117639668 [Thrips palmi]|uniref:phospholipase A2 n=1 Tax=Thrips palmi TaxID=161013 RepID=A0A6P8XWL2_THRPL|nr:uncharacterized protein LOC117639668 [Thrips palmi]